ncbi:MAG: hypothetical protein WCE38_08135 [Burkholderiales bacterium]|jgi:hypothetical protein
MQAGAKSHSVSQLKLFHPTIVAPTWERMPREIREQTVRLLSRLLREHRASEREGKQPREACDE